MNINVEAIKREITVELQSLEAQKKDLTEDLKEVELRIEFAKGQLAALHRIDTPSGENHGTGTAAKHILNAPSISVGDAIREGMYVLQEFTKADIIKWVRSKYPLLEFSQRSCGRPLRELMQKGEILMIRPNVGNKTQAVYGIKKKGVVNPNEERS